MKCFPWECLKFRSPVFSNQPTLLSRRTEEEEKDKVQDQLLSNSQTGFKLLLIILLMNKFSFKITLPAVVWWNHDFSIPTIFKYRKWKKSRLTRTKLNDGINYGLLVYIYFFFLFWLALKSDLLTVTVVLSSPLRFYLTFKWKQKENK